MDLDTAELEALVARAIDRRPAQLVLSVTVGVRQLVAGYDWIRASVVAIQPPQLMKRRGWRTSDSGPCHVQSVLTCSGQTPEVRSPKPI